MPLTVLRARVCVCVCGCETFQRGKTALDMAKASKHTEAVKLLAVSARAPHRPVLAMSLTGGVSPIACAMQATPSTADADAGSASAKRSLSKTLVEAAMEGHMEVRR